MVQQSKQTITLGLIVGLVSTLALMGCGAKNDNKGSLVVSENEKGFFSNRPTKPETDPKKNYFFGMVKLKTPSALSVAKIVNGKAEIDPKQLEAIATEQNEFLKVFATLSPDVRAVYRYRYLMNAVAIYVPGDVVARLRSLKEVGEVVEASHFHRPLVEVTAAARIGSANWAERNSVKFIGAEAVRLSKVRSPDGTEVALDGTGMKVGIIDTGVDFTHKMLGGEGTEAAYKAVDPSKATSVFPNNKVVGGIDLVGSDYDSNKAESRLPIPDQNPIDESGHGSHVAGTVAGIGDGVETYSGVAPGASLYAIKVFGKEGSTDDPVVIAGLEYAVDPNGDGKLDDQLDVVNLSLGSPYGTTSAYYSEAVRNLSRAGTVVVASAGNSGDFKYITGEPATSVEAISVAASVDDMLHNWQFRAVKIDLATGPVLAPAVESTISKPIAQIGEVTGKFVFLGIADTDLTEEQKSALKGNVAFIDRGKVTFETKIRRAAEGGAIGVVIVNNVPGEPLGMGGEGEPVDIPAIMVTKDLGDCIKEQMKTSPVVIQFKTPDKFQRPELIDTITGFSSRGPRSTDALIKPEISAPGASIVSAKVGGGAQATLMSGTSMAGPHIAGVMTLLKQSRPGFSTAELKSMLLGTAKTISEQKSGVYPVARQGSGRVQVVEAVNAQVLSDKSTLSLGFLPIQTMKVINQFVELKNISGKDLVLNADLDARSPHIGMGGLQGIELKAGSSARVLLKFLLSTSNMKESVRELDGWVKFKTADGVEVMRLPVLAIAQKVSMVQPLSLTIDAVSEADAPKSSAELKIANTGANDADVLLFNLLDVDERKKNTREDDSLNRNCDLSAAGYRIVKKTVDGREKTVLQVAAKLFEPLTSWHACDFSVLIDTNSDSLPDQELALIRRGAVTGLSAPGKDEEIIGVLVDSVKARQVREAAEAAAPGKDGKKADPDYSEALLAMAPLQIYEHSTVLVIEADVTQLKRRATGELAIRLATTDKESNPIEQDDFLGTLDDWMKISIQPESQSYVGLPETFKLKAGTEETISFSKGFGKNDLLILMPQNPWVVSDQLLDSQGIVARPTYTFGKAP